MTKGSAVARFVGNTNDSLLSYWCDGCDLTHMVHVKPVPDAPQMPVWGFNGSLEKPTLEPSVLVNWKNSSNERLAKIGTCHSFVRDGIVQFLDDCGHGLAGMHVPLKPVTVWHDK